MARQVKLTPDQLDALTEASHSTVRPGAHTTFLATAGLVVEGTSRFGRWVKITEKGRAYLSMAQQMSLVAATRPAKAGQLLRGAAPRIRRNAATNAR